MANRQGTLKTPQEVIKSFMARLVKHGYTSSTYSLGTAMLDSAIRASSRYINAQQVIDAMLADQMLAEKMAIEEVLGEEYADKTLAELPEDILSANAKNYDPQNLSNAYDISNDARTTVEALIVERKAQIFLEDFCGIKLNKEFYFEADGLHVSTHDVSTGNVDTGAITGSDANISLPAYIFDSDEVFQAVAASYGDKAQIVTETFETEDGPVEIEILVIGTGKEKTSQSVVPETLINTYIASTDAAQNISTGTRNWVVQATAADDTITSDGADSINSGAGNDQINLNSNGATVTSGAGSDKINVAENVRNVIINDLSSDDIMTISGTFEVGAVTVEDMMLVITDKTGKRKIRLGDFANATAATVNVDGKDQKLDDWLTDAGININDFATADETESSDNPAPSNDTPRNSGNAVNVNLDDYKNLKEGDAVKVDNQDVGTVSSSYPGATTFTRNGLTIHLLGVSNSKDGEPIDEDGNSTITQKTYDELTTDQKTIIAGLFKWWASDCLTLNEESYGIGFTSNTAGIKNIGLYFFDGDENNKTLATVYNFGTNNSVTDGAVTDLFLNVNMTYYKDILATDVDGTSSFKDASLLDRTLAHEFTHAVMSTNINYFGLLPEFVKEGMAELTHGIDDDRGSELFLIASNADLLEYGLYLYEPGVPNVASYSSGYMFLHYFATHAALQTIDLPAFGDITVDVDFNNLNVADGSVLYIDTAEANPTIQIAEDMNTALSIPDPNETLLILGTIGSNNGELYYSIDSDMVKQNITTSANLYKVLGLNANTKLNGSAQDEYVEVAEGATKVNTGDGNDSVQVTGQHTSVNTGADDDTVYIYDGGHNIVDLGDGNNEVVIEGYPVKGNGNYILAANFANTIIGGDGNDSLNNGYGYGFLDAYGYGNAYHAHEYAGQDNYGQYYVYGSYYDDGGNLVQDYIPVNMVLSNQSNSYYNVDLGDGDNQINLDYVYDSSLKTGAGKDNINLIFADHVSIETGAENDFVYIDSEVGTNNIIDTDDDADTVIIASNENTIKTGAGEDLIVFGKLNDSMQISSYAPLENNLIDLGDGDDEIDFAGTNNTIRGGKGNDYIVQIDGSTGGNVFICDSEFGNDSIEGFLSNDTIHIAENYTPIYQDNILYVLSGDVIKGTITFEGGTFDPDKNVVADLKDSDLALKTDKDGNYLIETADDLKTLADYVNNGNDTTNLTFKQTADIDLKDVNFAPIGWYDDINEADYFFAGTYDGGNFTISNLTINNATSDYQALFGENGGTIQNVCLVNANITGNDFVGALVGYNKGTVKDCLIDGGSVTGTGNNVGSFVGFNDEGTVSGYYHNINFTGDASTTATEVFVITLPENVTASGGTPVTFGEKNYYKKDSTVILAIDEEIQSNAVYAIADETYTVTKDEEVTPTLYISVDGGEYTNEVAKISVIGGDDNETIINTAEYVTLDGGGGNDSLVGSDNADVFVYSSGDDTVKGFSAVDDTIRLADGISVDGNPQADGNNLTINFAGSGKLIIEGAASLNAIDIYNADGSGKNTYSVEYIGFNNDSSSKATSVTVESAYGDLGKQNANGSETYAKVTTITASQDNSTIIGNAKNNKIIVEGGSDNILTGGLGKDTYNFTEGGGIITDFGIGATKSGSGKKFATSTTNKNYDRTDPETYARGTDVVRVNGKVSGIYFERDSDTAQDATFTAVITYTSKDGDEQIVVLNEIAKKPTKTNSNPDKVVYQTNDVAAKSLKIWDTSGSKRPLISSTKLKKLFKDDDELTTCQKAQVYTLTELIKPATDIITTTGEGSTFTNPLTTPLVLNSNKPKD